MDTIKNTPLNTEFYYISCLELSERNIYGSSRIGQEQIGEIIASTDINLVDINTETQNIIGDKYFEMSNHLGNVLEIVTDRKIPEPDGVAGVEYFTANVVSWNDYYPFGMQIPGRNYQSDEYRYGFNGMESDNEVKGERNSYTTHFRQYDPRVGRWLSIDPKVRYWESPYASFGNNPIMYSDPHGDTLKVSQDIESTSDVSSIVRDENQQYLRFNSDESISFDFGDLSQNEISDIFSDDEGMALLNEMIQSDKVMYYTATENLTIQERNSSRGGYRTKTVNLTAQEGGIINSSRNGLDGLGNNIFIPVDQNIDGLVAISPSVKIFEPKSPEKRMMIYKKSRASIVFHELAENLERTHGGCDYATIWTNPNSRGYLNPSFSPQDEGAHQTAIEREMFWHGKSRAPGVGYHKRSLGLRILGEE